MRSSKLDNIWRGDEGDVRQDCVLSIDCEWHPFSLDVHVVHSVTKCDDRQWKFRQWEFTID